MKRYSRTNPSDSRIFINFKTKQVDFEYPCKKSAFYIVYVSILSPYIKIFMMFLVMNLLLFSIFLLTINDFTKGNSANSLIEMGYLIIVIEFIVFLIAIPPLFITLFIIRSEKHLKQIPYFNLIINKISNNGYKYVKITSKDIKKDVNGKYIYTLPVFDNVFLDYKLVDDFKKHISKIEIKEYNFKHKKVNLRNEITKDDKQTEYWYCDFIFNGKPKNGYLEIFFS
jgi:hypothetical protein